MTPSARFTRASGRISPSPTIIMTMSCSSLLPSAPTVPATTLATPVSSPIVEEERMLPGRTSCRLARFGLRGRQVTTTTTTRGRSRGRTWQMRRSGGLGSVGISFRGTLGGDLSRQFRTRAFCFFLSFFLFFFPSSFLFLIRALPRWTPASRIGRLCCGFC